MYGWGTLLAKTDIEAAFHLLQVHPDNFRLLECQWQGQYYVNCCLPMGCAISCSLFETFSTFLEYVVRMEACIPLELHYLDDLWFLCPPVSRVCGILLHTKERVTLTFRVLLAPDKTKGLATVVKFFWILIWNIKC